MKTQSEKTNQYYYLVVAGAFMLMMSVALGTVCLSFFVKPVTDDLGFERGAFTFYYSLIFLVGIIVTPFMGKYIQKNGARQIVIAGSLAGGLAFFQRNGSGAGDNCGAVLVARSLADRAFCRA